MEKNNSKIISSLVIDSPFREQREKYELLMPAGDFLKAKYAIAFGADAIYCGIPMFTLRGKSNTPFVELRKIIPYARERGVKVYLAVNVFPHSFKYEQFMKDMQVMVNDLRPDAFIMADPGLIGLTREHFPTAVVHLSVQANNVNWMSAAFWQKQGITRVILARELTLREVQHICKQVPGMDFEFFVHGSNCMAYSGRCLLSNYMNYRDSNQGVCNNACRFQYKLFKAKDEDFMEPLQAQHAYKKPSQGTFFVEEQLRKGELWEVTEDENGSYLFNARDNCMVDYIKDLKDAGICSFKVEGRTKSVYYASIVARSYRKVLDDLFAGKTPNYELAFAELNTTSNRGFMPGFLTGNPKENAQDYEKRGEYQTHVFVALVKNVVSSSKTKSVLDLEVRGKFSVNEELEFVMPYPQEVQKTSLKYIHKVHTEGVSELQSVSGGLVYLVRVEVPFEVKDEFCVVRRKLQDQEMAPEEAKSCPEQE